jgi:hypothetical protein
MANEQMHGWMCPNDAMWIPQVAECSAGAEPVRFYWCWSCEELFAYVGEGPLIGRLAAGFARDEEAVGGWRVWKAVGSEHDMQLAMEAVKQVPRQRPHR